MRRRRPAEVPLTAISMPDELTAYAPEDWGAPPRRPPRGGDGSWQRWEQLHRDAYHRYERARADWLAEYGHRLSVEAGYRVA